MDIWTCGRKAMSMATAVIILGSILATFVPASIADHPHPIPPGETTILYFHPDNTSSPYSGCKVVQVYVNTTRGISGGQLAIHYDESCINVTNWERNTALWPVPPGAGWSRFSGGVWITFGKAAPDIEGDLLIGNLTICCNKTCCGSNLLFGIHPLTGLPTKIVNATGGTVPHVTDNGTFICGNPLVVNKTVWDPINNQWVKALGPLPHTWKGKDVRFNITIESKCLNLSNVVINDTMDPSLKYNGSATSQPDSYTDQTVNWTVGSLSAGSSFSIEFNATIIDYGTDDNTANVHVNVTNLGVPLEAQSKATVTTMPPARTDVTGFVWDPVNKKWVDQIKANISDLHRIRYEINNTGSIDLEDIRFWGNMSCSLEYAGNATLVTPDGVERDITLPTILHLHSAIYPLDKPDNWTSTWWHELYPNFSSEYLMKTWRTTMTENSVQATRFCLRQLV